MRILLPPSEGKASRGRGRSLELRGLAEPRRAVLEAVSAWCSSDPVAATRGLGLPATTAAADLEANRRLLTSPTMPAIDRFRGVLFDGLAVDSLSTTERRTALRVLLVSSGAFGLLGAGEPVPDHRVPMSATVPGPGGLGSYWRRHLGPVIPTMLAGRHLVVDLRSLDYLSAPPVPQAARRRVLSVRVLTQRGPDRSVVSYSSKLTKGRLARALVQAEASGAAVRSPGDVAEIAVAAGLVVEQSVTGNGQPALDVVLPA